jgi:serine/threonine protein kinase
MGPSIYRQTFFDHRTLTKKIDITRNSGQNLQKFISIHQNNLSPIQIEQLSAELLTQYLVQIQDKGLVHTDIKAQNICIKITERAEHPFEVVFIDFEEAFFIEAPSAKGRGTPGYMAPEFFKTRNDFEMQLENRGIDLLTYCNTLKLDFKSLFSVASDIYSLGFVLLNDLPLDHTSDLYHLAHLMCHSEADHRPSANDIRERLSAATIQSRL